MNDIDHYIGGDIAISATADVNVATALTASQQRVLRRLLTNPGDYISLFADASGLSVAWSDGRDPVLKNPDIYMSYWTQSEVSSVPPPATGTLALAGAWPNPATSASVIAFTLAGGNAATLDLLDLNGRRVLSRSLSPGATSVPLTNGARLRPGVYFVRLTQDGVSRSKRIVVL